MQPDARFDFQLEADLAAAGAIARSAADQAPSPAFAYGLRSHLLTAHAAAGAAVAVGALPRRSRFSRFAPLFAMMLALGARHRGRSRRLSASSGRSRRRRRRRRPRPS